MDQKQSTPDASRLERPIDGLIAALCSTIRDQREQVKALEELATTYGDSCATYRLLYQAVHRALEKEQQRLRYERAARYRLEVENRDLRAEAMLRAGVAA